jgi:hypothetical protein
MTDERNPNGFLSSAKSSPPPEPLQEASINAMVAMADYLAVEAREISATAALFLLLARHELRTMALERSGFVIRLLGSEKA